MTTRHDLDSPDPMLPDLERIYDALDAIDALTRRRCPLCGGGLDDELAEEPRPRPRATNDR